MKRIILLLLIFLLCGWTKIGINFRASAPYVTDGTDECYDLGIDAAYPIVNRCSLGATYGWTAIYADCPRDRNNALDRRLAGMCQQPNTGQGTFRLNIVNTTSTYKICLALGDGSFGKDVYAELRDNATVRFTVSDLSVAGGSFVDANGTELTAANWAASQVCKTGISIASGILILAIGANGGGGHAGDSAVAHLYVEEEAAPVTARSTGQLSHFRRRRK